MNLLPGTGITIDAEIVDPSQWVYRMVGAARGLLRLEISTTVAETRKILVAYPANYNMLSKPEPAPITLVFGAEEYEAKLNMPPTRVGTLISGKPLKTAYLEPWISAGPVTDKHGSDVKLAGALVKAEFPVNQWTDKAMSNTLPKPKACPLLTVKFRVEGKRWHLLSSASAQSGRT